MKIDTLDRLVNWSEECARLRREGKEPPELELTDNMRRILLATVDKSKATESERQLVGFDLQRELLEELSKPKSKSLADQYGIPDATP
jgi:hypothetical protein